MPAAPETAEPPIHSRPSAASAVMFPPGSARPFRDLAKALGVFQLILTPRFHPGGKGNLKGGAERVAPLFPAQPGSPLVGSEPNPLPLLLPGGGGGQRVGPSQGLPQVPQGQFQFHLFPPSLVWEMASGKGGPRRARKGGGALGFRLFAFAGRRIEMSPHKLGGACDNYERRWRVRRGRRPAGCGFYAQLRGAC